MDSNIKQRLETDFSDLLVKSLEIIGDGWDNVAYLVNEDTVFRLPKPRSVHLNDKQINHNKVEINVLNYLQNKLNVKPTNHSV